MLFLMKEFLITFENDVVAQKCLVPALLEAFDSRYWLSISNIFLNMAKRTGFGQVYGTLSRRKLYTEFAELFCRAVNLTGGTIHEYFVTFRALKLLDYVVLQVISLCTHNGSLFCNNFYLLAD